MLPWVVDLAPVGVERLGGIRDYLTTASCSHGARHLCYVVMAYHSFVMSPDGLRRTQLRSAAWKPAPKSCSSCAMASIWSVLGSPKQQQRSARLGQCTPCRCHMCHPYLAHWCRCVGVARLTGCRSRLRLARSYPEHGVGSWRRRDPSPHNQNTAHVILADRA